MVNTPDTVELERVDHSTDGSSLVAAETSSLITPMTKMFRSRAHSHSAVSEFRFISLTIIRKEEILFEKMATKLFGETLSRGSFQTEVECQGLRL